jgi:hypothetical protein
MDKKTSQKILELIPSVRWAATAAIDEAEGVGIFVSIREAYRSYAAQVTAYNRFLRGEIAAAAKPGHSLHQLGLATDVTVVPSSRLKEFVAICKKYGITQPLPKSDPYHLEYNHVKEAPQAPQIFGGYPDANSQLKGALNASLKPQSPTRMAMLTRLIQRLRKLIYGS